MNREGHRKEIALNPVLQEIVEMASAELNEDLSQELEFSEEWDADAFEQEVREFTREIGKTLLQTWAKAKAKQAEAKTSLCSCGRKLQRGVTPFSTRSSVECQNFHFFTSRFSIFIPSNYFLYHPIMPDSKITTPTITIPMPAT